MKWISITKCLLLKFFKFVLDMTHSLILEWIWVYFISKKEKICEIYVGCIISLILKRKKIMCMKYITGEPWIPRGIPIQPIKSITCGYRPNGYGLKILKLILVFQAGAHGYPWVITYFAMSKLILWKIEC